MSRKRGLSEEEIRNILQTTSYLESEGEDIEIESDDEFIPPPCSSSDEGSSTEEVQVTEGAFVHDDSTVSKGNFVTECVCVLLNLCVTEYVCLLLNI